MKIGKNLKAEAAKVFGNKQSYITALRLALPVIFLAGGSAQAALIDAFNNLSTLTQAAITLMIAVGVLAGLGFIFGACMSLYKKYDRGQDDITWSKIGMQFGAGALCMALGFVGVQVVETMGGGAGDIGRAL